MSEPFIKKTYYTMTLDPVHIGTGGYRLGRVDNTIVREPGTNLPKIPGSSIAGATRAYTAMAVQSNDPTREKYQRDSGERKKIKKDDGTEIEEIIYESCAGKGIKDGEGHCGEHDCEVCVPFGFSKGKSGSSFQGLAQFYDARILFFPVHSMIGPVWVTSPTVLKDFIEAVSNNTPPLSLTFNNNLSDTDKEIQTDLVGVNKTLNLGWIQLKNINNDMPVTGTIPNLKSEIQERLVLVPDKLFSRIINDNLEVRTSVAIDPATGAAESGALFTSEAIPRATVMWFDVVYNKPEYFRIDGQEIQLDVKANVQRGLPYLESLGVGGMNTRGMGRLRILNLEESNGNT